MDYKKYNDYELIDRIRENDDDSRSIMFDKYQPIIRKLAGEYYQKFATYGYQFEDFVQEGMIAFYKALSAYNEQKDSLFYSFVVLCIQRALTSFCRNISNVSKNISSNYLFDINECSIEDEQSNINAFLKEQEQHSFIKDFILNLPLEIGAIIELKWNGFSYREIGILLDIPSSSVEFKSRKARLQLQKKFHKIWCK